MKPFRLTDKQIEQRILLASQLHSMSYGGSRSGKTFGKCRGLIARSMKCKSRHLAVRLKFNHAKTSLWYETFPKVFRLAFPDLKLGRDYFENKSDWFYRFRNGSEIWIGGLDEKERVEKILGKEYSTIFFNECSQIPYTSIGVALTRLAEQNELTKRAWYDENPPTKRHWSYPLFILGKDPDTWEPISDPQNYSHILMNPTDNLENIDENYVSGILAKLPTKQKARFLEGKFNDDASGSIYYAFSREKHVKPQKRIEKLPLAIGMDFNVNPFTFVIGQVIEHDEFGLLLDEPVLRILDEGWLPNSNTPAAAKDINRRYPGRWTVIPDGTGKNRHTSQMSGKTDHQHLKDHGLIVPRVRNPFRVDRYNEVNDMFEKMRIEIDPKCKRLIADLEKVAYEDGTNMPDTKDQELTHISDALGYLVHYYFPMVKIETSVSMGGNR